MACRTFLGVVCVLGLTLLTSLNSPALDTNSTATLTLAWDPSTDPTVVGYRVYEGVESQVYTNVVDVGDADTTTLTGLVPGVTYYFAVTAYDANGLESAFSGEINYTVPMGPASPPTVVADLELVVNDFGQATIYGTAPAGYVYSVQVSDDLVSWATIGTVTADSTGWLQFTDPLSPFYPTRSYRFQQISTQ